MYFIKPIIKPVVLSVTGTFWLLNLEKGIFLEQK